MPNEDTKIFLGGLWVNETKDGKKYMSGGFGVGGKLLLFANGYKNKDSDPDYKLYLVAKEKKQETGEPQPPSFDGAPGVDADDIPF